MQEKPQKKLTELRSKVITIRMKPSIHKMLMDLAKKEKTSLSKYMIQASIEKTESK